MEIFQSILDKLLDRNNESIKLSISHCHAKGIFSLVVDGNEFGKLTRVFIADRKLRPFEVQFHTHTYPLRLTVLKGSITHHLAHKTKDGPISIPEYSYTSFLNGGDGLKYIGQSNIECNEYKIPIGGTVELKSSDFHTLSCSKSSIWIVEELGFDTKESNVLGVPFVLDGLYTEPAMFQINDKCQIVIYELKKILECYRYA